MRRIFNPVLAVVIAVVMFASSLGAEVVVENGQVKRGKFKFKDGTEISADVSSPNQVGVLFRYTEGDMAGKFTKRYKWEEFSQETLKDFLQDNRVKNFVQLLIEIKTEDLNNVQDEALPERKSRPPVDVKPVPKAKREFADASLFGALFSGSGLMLLLAVYVANLYAAYEVAFFRNYPFPIVCGTSAVLPVLGFVIFLCMPTKEKKSAADEAHLPQPGDTAEALTAEELEAVVEEVAPVMEAAPVVVQIPATQVFKRGEVAINRRFIETKFAPFFRVIIGDNEKDLRLVVKSSKGEFVGNRVSKVTQTDMSLQITNESGASIEETFPIADIFEIQIRHKDAPEQ
ncbi:MAG TPA: hypothetical protein VGH19_11085 [Verrucomicrobiae bacterium]